MPGAQICAALRVISSFALPVDELVPFHERRQIRLVRDVEEDRRGCR